MRRILLGSLLAATVAFPALASAKVAPMVNPAPRQQPPTIIPRSASLGNGMIGGNEPGHVVGPGKTAIDNDSRAPINDVNPGRGTEDTPQSKNPPPAH